METIANILRKAVEYWYVGASLVIASCILCIVVFMLGWENAAAAFGLLAFAALIFQPVILLFALFQRQWSISLQIVGGIIGSIFVGIITAVLFGAGQYRPPHQAEELIDTDSTEVIEEEPFADSLDIIGNDDLDE